MKPGSLHPDIRPRSYVVYNARVYFFLGMADDGMAEIQRTLGERCIRVPLDALILVSSKKLPVERLHDFAEYPPHKQAKAKLRLEAIRPLMEQGPSPDRIQAAARALGVSPVSIGRLLDRYLLSGQRISALVPRAFSYGVVNRKLNPRQKELLGRVLNEFYLVPERPTQQQTIERVQRVCRNEGVKEIGDSSVIRALREIPGSEVAAQRLGLKGMREIFRAHRGKAPVGERPLALVEIDHSPTDIFVRLPSGKAYRPWITIAIDTYSRMILGFYLTPEAPSQLSVGLCLYRAMMHKAEWLRRYGITAEWPCHGRWVMLVADNAKEFRGYFLLEVGLEHDLSISFRGIGSANWGSHIERLMGRTAREMHMLPGTSFGNPVERGDYNPTDHAVLTLEKLEELFLRMFVEVYHCSPHEGLGGRTPLSVWNEYFASTGEGANPHYPQVRAGQDLLISLLPHFRRTIQQDGVAWEGNQYFDAVLGPYIRQPNPKRADKLWRFHFDPRDIRQIWFRHPASGAWFPIPLRDASAQGVTLWELQDYQAKEREEAAGTVDQKSIDQGRNAIDAIVEEARSLKGHRAEKRRRKQVQKLLQKEDGPQPMASQPTPPASDLVAWTPLGATEPWDWDEQDYGAFAIEGFDETSNPDQENSYE